MDDLYIILGLTKDATIVQIKQAHRKLVLKFHPDVAGEEGRETFEKIQYAYQVLTDENKRAEYDETGQVTEQMNAEMRLKSYLAGEFVELLQYLQHHKEKGVLNPASWNPPEMLKFLKQKIQADVDEASKQDKILDGRLQDCQSLKGKFTGDSFFDSVLDAQITNYEQAQKKIKDKLKLMTDTLKFLKTISASDFENIFSGSSTKRLHLPGVTFTTTTSSF